MQSFGLDSKVALVTGAGSGIGRGIAEAFVSAGARVGVWDINADALLGLARELGDGCLADEVDVTDTQAVETGLESLWAGLGPVEILVTGAGITSRSPLESLSDEDFENVLDVNLGGTFRCARAAGRRLIATNRGGSLIGIASISGLVANRGGDNSHYSLTKGGVIAFTRSLAVEWAKHGIRVNAIAPGYTVTPMTDRLRSADPEFYQSLLDRVPLGRFASPTDVASAAVFLASPAAAYVTGHVLVVDGGYTSW